MDAKFIIVDAADDTYEIFMLHDGFQSCIEHGIKSHERAVARRIWWEAREAKARKLEQRAE